MTFAVPRSIPIFMTAGCYSGGGADTPVRGPREGVVTGRSGGVGRPGDARAELLELAVDVLIPPLDVVSAVDQRGALGRECGQDQRGAGPEVADRDLAAAQARRAVYGRVVGVLDVD